MQTRYGRADLYRHIEEAHKSHLRKDKTVFAARRLDSLNRPGLRLVDPCRTERHILRHWNRLRHALPLVRKIVRDCMAEGFCAIGDERRRNDTKEILGEFEFYLSTRKVFDEPYYFSEYQKNVL